MSHILESAEALKKMLPSDKTICLVGGCFDLIHVGHLHLLEYASTLENLLVVAVLSDGYIRGYKDTGRPVINQKQRAAMVASIRFVDRVYISDQSPNSSSTLCVLRPDSVVFGIESGREEELSKRIAQVRASVPKTKVRLLARYDEEEISTGYIIDKIRKG